MLISKLCRWFGVPRRTLYYRPQKAAPKLQP
ncbi:helix-turn-helix domain-containing protein [Vogesella sp. XCS3]|nr:helix-turn-helix domain-containing protein [Vogesella sp. XCS3]